MYINQGTYKENNTSEKINSPVLFFELCDSSIDELQ